MTARLPHALLAQQQRLDLAQFDAESSHFDLSVDTAEEKERAVFPPQYPISGAITAGPPERAPEKALSMQRS